MDSTDSLSLHTDVIVSLELESHEQIFRLYWLTEKSASSLGGLGSFKTLPLHSLTSKFGTMESKTAQIRPHVLQ